MMTMVNPALARYLAYQRDIGVDEIILDEPLVLPNMMPKVTSALPGVRQAPQPSPASADFAESSLARSEMPLQGDGQALLRQVAERLAGKSGDRLAAAPEIPARRAEPGPALQGKSFATLAAWREAFEAEVAALHPTVKKGKAGDPEPWVYGSGANQPTLAVITLQPATAPESELWARMLKAMKLESGEQYFTSLMKAPHPGRGWARKDTVKLIPWLEAELSLIKPQMVLLLGEDLAQLLLRVGLGYEAMRQKSQAFAGFEVVMTHGLGRLLAQEELKRDAWKDLQWLMQRLTEKGAIA